MKTLSLSQFLAANHFDKDNFEAIRMAMYAFMAFFSINAEWIVILLSFMLLDTIFGLVKAARMKESISMSTLMWGITIKLCILCVPFILAALAMVFGENLKFIVDIIIRLLIVNECLSIIANIISIKTKKNVKNLDLISLALNAVRKWLYGIGKKMIEEALPVEDSEKENKN